VSDADRQRWDARHAAAGPAVPAPPAAFAGAAGLTSSVPTAGRALDVACGRGAVAVWLARRGLAVDAVDIAPAGLAAGAALAERCGVAGRIRWIAHDLDGGLPADCAGPYEVAVCQLFRDPDRYGALAAALAPGGLLAITVLSEVDADPGPFRARPGELRAAFAGLDVLLERETDGEATLLARAPLG
jgi:SAM-dependent methyltransferase